MAPGEHRKIMPPNRTLQLELQMIQPIRRLHQNRAFAYDGIGDACAIGSGEEANLLLDFRRLRTRSGFCGLGQRTYVVFTSGDFSREAVTLAGNGLDEPLTILSVVKRPAEF
jgi:hypothetical protein